MNKITIQTLAAMKSNAQKIACLTCYDYSFARLLEQAGVDVLLVGDSAGMVIEGRDSTLAVTLEQMIYHGASIARGNNHCLRVIDMPFGTYEADPRHAFHNARRLVAEGGAHAVKLEGAGPVIECTEFLARRGILVCAHLGLTPQHVHSLGGYKTQGREDDAAARLLDDAKAIQDAGAQMMVLECVPAHLAKRVTAALDIPVIGIGAGADCDGQILVLYDVLGLYPGGGPKFSKDFTAGNNSLRAAVEEYVRAVREGEFPGAEQTLRP